MATEQKTERLREALRKVAANFVEEESNQQSLITVTDVLLKNKNKQATILVSVMPVHKEEAVIDFLKRKRSACHEFLRKEIRGALIPFIDFAIDMGEKNRQRIEEISKNS